MVGPVYPTAHEAATRRLLYSALRSMLQLRRVPPDLGSFSPTKPKHMRRALLCLCEILPKQLAVAEETVNREFAPDHASEVKYNHRPTEQGIPPDAISGP